jgi:hypothetical protein
VKRTGYHRYFDYPRTGKYGWKHWMPSIKQISGGFLAGVFLIIGLIAFEYETVQIPDEHSAAFATESVHLRRRLDEVRQRRHHQPADRPVQPDPDDDPGRGRLPGEQDLLEDPGVSYTGTARALLVDLTGGSTQGGSTITQQYVKNAFLTQAQTTSRKIDEIFISLKLAKTLRQTDDHGRTI